MKRLLSGFTMAEVLITIGLIGVVAAMTLPALNMNIQKHQVGPSLLKGINTLENGSRLLLQRDEARNLFDACSNYNYVGEFTPSEEGEGEEANSTLTHSVLSCMLASGIFAVTESADLRTVKDYNLSSEKSFHCIDSSDGISFCEDTASPSIADMNAVEGHTVGRQYDGRAYFVYIDVNGPKATNTIGKDIFKVLLDGKGIVIPFGGSVYKNYAPNQEAILWKTDGSKCTGEKVDDGDSCAGAIADNGWKISY